MKRLVGSMPAVAGVMVSLCAWGAAAWSWGQASAPVDDARSLAARVESLGPLRITQVDALRDYGVATQMADAELFFLIGDYESTSLRLIPLVEEPRMRSHPARSRARWLLAESLYEQRNYAIASTYYEQASAERDPDYGRASAIRLLEIALEVRDFRAVDQRFDELTSRYGGEATPEVEYLRGRALYRRGSFPAAQQAFDRVPDEHPEYGARARYLSAVCLTRMGDLGSALAALQRLEASLDGAMPLSEDWEVLQLSRLAQGRLHYEDERWDDAVNAYARVNRDSRWFQDALYEISWTMIREERYEDAVNNLEVLSIISDNTRFVAEARLLMGDMRRRADQLDQALVDFTAVSDDYDLMREQLIRIAQEPGSAAQRFSATEQIDTGGVIAPFRMSDWVVEDEEVAVSLQIVREADAVNDLLRRNSLLADEIREALGSQARYERVPEAQAYRNQLLLLLAESVDLRIRTVNAVRDVVVPGLSAEQQAAYREVAARRQQAEREFRSAPRTVDGLQGGSASVRSELETTILGYYRAELEIEQQLEDLRNTEAMVRQQTRSGLQPSAEASDLSAERARLQTQLEETREVRLGLERERTRLGVGEMRARTERRAQAVIELLAEEHGFLVTSSGQASPVPGSDSVLAELTAVERRLAELSAVADREVDVALGNLREQLEAEERALALLNNRQAAQQQAGVAAADAIAMSGYRRVQARLDEVTLRADVGIIDVAWWEKERLSVRIASLFREKERQLRILDSDFAEIRGQED